MSFCYKKILGVFTHLRVTTPNIIEPFNSEKRNKATYQSFPLSFQDYPSQKSKIDQHCFADLLD